MKGENYLEAEFRKMYDEMKEGICKECRGERVKKFGNSLSKVEHHDIPNITLCYPVNLAPIDVLLVLKSLAEPPKEKEDFYEMVSGMSKWYGTKKDDKGDYIFNYKKFHQECIHNIIQLLEINNKKWVFTDLVKCYIKNDKKKYPNNFELAVSKCIEILKKQIKILEPKIILMFGVYTRKSIEKYITKKHDLVGNLGEGKPCKLGGKEVYLMYSTFPAGRTADDWIEKDAENVLAEALSKQLGFPKYTFRREWKKETGT